MNVAGVKFECLSVKFKISALEFFKKIVSCCVKNLKLRTKNALFRYFWGKIEKDIAIFGKEKVHAECKIFQYGTETAFFRLTLKKLLTYLKSAPSNLLKCKISGKSAKS